MSGKVINEAPFGVFVELKPGIEALLHNSEIPEGREKPKTGSVITTKIIKIDPDERKIGLTLRDIEQEPKAVKPGTEGTVKEQVSEQKSQVEDELALVTSNISSENSAPSAPEINLGETN